MKKLTVLAVLALAFMASGRVLAQGQSPLARAHYDHSDPAVGAATSGSPETVTIWFTRGLDPEQANEDWIRVVAQDGSRVDLNDSHIIGDDNSGLVVSLQPGLSDGSYIVNWANVSNSYAGLYGTFIFGVGIAAPDGGFAEWAEDYLRVDARDR